MTLNVVLVSNGKPQATSLISQELRLSHLHVHGYTEDNWFMNDPDSNRNFGASNPSLQEPTMSDELNSVTGWVLIGYFPKRRAVRVGWTSPYTEYPDATFPSPAPVEEICSASHCISRRPEKWTEEINVFMGYDSPEAAWRAVPIELSQHFGLYAYRLLPALFREGLRETLEVPELSIAPMPHSFERLGYDAVELSHGQSLGCSPLSCNNQTISVPLNPYCLVDDPQQGVTLAQRFSVEKPEPGPYCVVEVWRDQRDRDGDTPAR